MASEDLEQQFDRILAAAEPQHQEEKPVEEAEEKEIIEEGVDNAAESKEETESKEEEGQTPSDDLDEEFKNLDPELREILSKADAETRKAQANAFKKMRATFDRKATELGQEKKIAENTRQLFSKYGLNAETGLSQIEKLIHFERELEKDPKKIVGLLRQKFNLQDSGSDENKLDESLLTDEERIIYKEQKDIKKTVESLVEENKRLKEGQERKEIESARIEIERFKDSKNSDGSLKNPYFDELIVDIGRLTELYPNDNIEALYNKAMRLNDDVYAKSLEDAKTKERARILSEKEAAIKKAKSINSQSLKPSKVSEQRSLDDILLGILENSSN